KVLRRGEEDDQPGRYLQHNPEKTNNSVHLKVEWTNQWRVVQGSEKQVGELYLDKKGLSNMYQSNRRTYVRTKSSGVFKAVRKHSQVVTKKKSLPGGDSWNRWHPPRRGLLRQPLRAPSHRGNDRKSCPGRI
ncbi:unnamed protein product, partial [Ascophyllum nodosum]